MGNVSFSQLNFNSNNGGAQDDVRRLPYFAVGNGQSAMVRFMHASTDDFDLVKVHANEFTTKNGKLIRANVTCLADPTGIDMSGCPFCMNGEKVKTVMYVHLIEYVQTQNGIEAQPKVWQRPFGFAQELATLINDYGDLRNCIFKVSRTGEKLETKYSVNYVPESRYDANVYGVSDAVYKAFEGYDADGSATMKKTAAEMENFLATASWLMPRPQQQDTFQKVAETGYMTPDNDNEELPFGNETPATAASTVVPAVNQPAPAPAPVETPAPAPRRAPGNFPWQTNNAAPSRTY